jgi:hypothetical protein
MFELFSISILRRLRRRKMEIEKASSESKKKLPIKKYIAFRCNQIAP